MALSITDTQYSSALQYAECCYAECCVLFFVMLSVIILNVIILSVVMLNVVMLSVVMLNVVMLSVVMSSSGLYYKTLRIHNLRERDRFCGKLVSFGLEKYTSLNKQTHSLTTESVHNKSGMVLFYRP